ncbi:MAG: hypothetical protein GXP33_05720 [Spirochaetes bacterium]|nr:hypothetical protein [Spirochaetota bacterium]
MSIVSIGDLVGRAREFEKKLESYYSDIRDKSLNKGVRLLTYYLSRHRRHLEEVIKGFNNEAINRVFNVRLKYDIDFNPDANFSLIEKSIEEITGNELLKAACAYDEELVKLYKNILKQPLGEEAKLFMEGLLRLEEKDIVMMKKMIAMDYF